MRRVVLVFCSWSSLAGSSVRRRTGNRPRQRLITDANGAPLPGVAVMITGDRGEKATVTEEDGTYRFALLVPGSYAVKAALEGMGTADKTVQVTAGERSEITSCSSSRPRRPSPSPRKRRWSTSSTSASAQTMQSEVGVEVTGENRTFYGVVNFMPGVTNEDENADLSSTRPEHQRRHLGRLDRLHRRRRHHLLALRRHPRLHAVDGDHRGEPGVGRSGRRLRPHRRLGDQRHRQVGNQHLPRRRPLQPHRGILELRVRAPPRARAARVEPASRATSSCAPTRRRTRTTASTRPRSAVRSRATRPGSSSRSTSRTPTTPARPSTATSSTRAATSSPASPSSTSSLRPSTRWRSATSTRRCCATSCSSRWSTATA